MYKYDFKEFAREGEQITINESVYIPSMLPEHTHNFLEIFYMTEWHGQHEINGHRQPIREGEIWVLGFGTRHTLIPDRFGKKQNFLYGDQRSQRGGKSGRKTVSGGRQLFCSLRREVHIGRKGGDRFDDGGKRMSSRWERASAALNENFCLSARLAWLPYANKTIKQIAV